MSIIGHRSVIEYAQKAYPLKIATYLDVNGQWFIIMLHELGKIEQILKDFRRDGRSVERHLQAVNALILILLMQLGPTRDKASIEELTCQGRIDLARWINKKTAQCCQQKKYLSH